MKKILVAIIFIFAVYFLVYDANAQTDSGHFYVSFDNTKIYYEVKGDGYPVVLLHGFMNTGENMKKNAVYGALISAGYKVITLDMRGNGKSDKPHTDEAYANDAETKDIIGLMAQLNVKNYDALGYSRGSIITARLLVLDNRVNKAVMGGMGADFTNPEWPRRIMFYRALSGDTVKELEGVIQHVKEAGLDQQSLMLQQKYQPSTPKEALMKVQHPVLVICGDKDSDNGNAQDLAKLFPHAMYVQVPGNHGGAQATREFADAVVKFFNE
jgi:pimeloyl-ACP methyl ester carboxylesterase